MRQIDTVISPSSVGRTQISTAARCAHRCLQFACRHYSVLWNCMTGV